MGLRDCRHQTGVSLYQNFMVFLQWITLKRQWYSVQNMPKYVVNFLFIPYFDTGWVAILMTWHWMLNRQHMVNRTFGNKDSTITSMFFRQYNSNWLTDSWIYNSAYNLLLSPQKMGKSDVKCLGTIGNHRYILYSRRHWWHFDCPVDKMAILTVLIHCPHPTIEDSELWKKVQTMHGVLSQQMHDLPCGDHLILFVGMVLILLPQ